MPRIPTAGVPAIYFCLHFKVLQPCAQDVALKHACISECIGLRVCLPVWALLPTIV